MNRSRHPTPVNTQSRSQEASAAAGKGTTPKFDAAPGTASTDDIVKIDSAPAAKPAPTAAPTSVAAKEDKEDDYVDDFEDEIQEDIVEEWKSDASGGW